MRTSALLSMLTAALVICCSKAENKNAPPKPTAAPTQTVATNVSIPASPTATPTPFVSNAAAPPVSRVKSLPATGGDKPTKAEIDGYPYSYKKDGEKTVATFHSKPLPADRYTVADAINDVIARSYGEKVVVEPHIVGKNSAQAIRVTSNNHQYVVVVGSDRPNGEIKTLIITQLN